MSQELERYLRPRPAFPGGAWMIPVLIFTAAVFLAVRGGELATQADSVRTSNEQLVQARDRMAVPEPTPKALENQKRWNELREERDFPWDQVFKSVEQTDRSDIELLEFRPDKRNRRVILRGEAQDREAVAAYLEVLAKQQTLSHVHILQFQALTREGLMTFGFEIKATIR